MAHFKLNASILGGWIFAMLMVVIGIFNFLLIHPVPAAGYFMLSFVFAPPANRFLQNTTGISVYPIFKVTLGIVIIMFTLGVSDLGEMIEGPM